MVHSSGPRQRGRPVEGAVDQSRSTLDADECSQILSEACLVAARSFIKKG